MAVSTWRKRKLQIGERSFLWWIAPDLDTNDLLLHICSADRRFRVHHALGLPADRRHIVVIGPELPPLRDTGGCWIRLGTPSWDEAIVTPGLVRQIIEWCLDASKEIIRVNPWGLR
jgi:hypothetical protein